MGDEARPGDGPVRRGAPGVRAHHEHADRRLAHDPVVDAAEPVVEPAELLSPKIDQARRAEVEVARPALGAPLPERVNPGPDQDLLAPPALGSPLGLHSHEVVEGALQEHVVPAAEPVGRDVDLRVVFLHVPEALPVGAVVRVADPVPVELADAPRALVARPERQVPEQRGVVLLRRHPEVLEPVRPRVHLHRAPPEVEPELEGAARVDPVVIEIREADARRHGGEMPVAERRRQPLREREVGRPARADLPGGPRLGPAPLLRVVAVLGLVDERRPHALRVEASAHVLDRHRVAVLGEVDRVLDAGRDVVAVGRADQDDGKRPRSIRQVEVGRELHPVAHRHADAQLGAHTVQRAEGRGR